MWELILMMKEIRNLTITVVTGDGTWGLCYNRSRCSGMIGMVNRKEVDFAIGTKDFPKKTNYI